MVASYEMIFTQPDSVTIQQNGDAVRGESDCEKHRFPVPESGNHQSVRDYVQNCVLGDIYLNHKYTLEDLMASADPYTLIFPPQPATGRL